MKIVDLFRLMRRTKNGRMVYDVTLKWYHKVVQPYRCFRLRLYGVEMLKRASKLLDKFSVEYYIYWGTLLGALREHDFIRADDDIDIIVNRNTQPSKIRYLINGLLEMDFTFVHVVRTKKKNLYITFKYKGVHIDFFFYDENESQGQIIYQGVYENSNVNYTNENECSTRYLKMPWCKPGGDISFKGLKLHIPSNPTAALVCSYGPNWGKPISGWKTPSDYYEYVDDLAQRYTNLNEVIL